MKTAAGKQRSKEGAIASQAAESIRRVGIVKAFSAETRTVDEFRSQARSAERVDDGCRRHAARMSRITEFLTGAGVALRPRRRCDPRSRSGTSPPANSCWRSPTPE